MRIIRLIAMAAVVLLMASCGGGNASKLADKVKDNLPLSEGDYTEMINYCGKFAEEAQKYQDKLNALPSDSPESDELTARIAELKDNNPDLDLFSSRIENCTEEEIGEKNVALINRYAGLTWFDAPSWADIQTTSDNIEGIIEQTPAEPSDTVIAGGAGVVLTETNK